MIELAPTDDGTRQSRWPSSTQSGGTVSLTLWSETPGTGRSLIGTGFDGRRVRRPAARVRQYVWSVQLRTRRGATTDWADPAAFTTARHNVEVTVRYVRVCATDLHELESDGHPFSASERTRERAATERALAAFTVTDADGTDHAAGQPVTAS